MPSTEKNDISLHIYAPALVGGDSRPVAVVHGMERAFPGLRLEWKVEEDGQLVALPQRDAWLVEETKDGGFPLVCNGDEGYPVMIDGSEHLAVFAPGGRALFEVHAYMPSDARGIAAAAAVLEAIAESARAFWGRATPFRASVDIVSQTKNLPDVPKLPPRGLPVIKPPEAVRSPEIPGYLGWLNYWSAAAAQAIGFPDPARDAELLSRSRRTASGAWVVRLTEALLDLDDPAHLDTLKRTYERFPEIGGRSAS